MNKIEVRNVEKYPFFCRSLWSFLFDGKPQYFYLPKSNKNWTYEKSKINSVLFMQFFFVFFVAFYLDFKVKLFTRVNDKICI